MARLGARSRICFPQLLPADWPRSGEGRRDLAAAGPDPGVPRGPAAFPELGGEGACEVFEVQRFGVFSPLERVGAGGGSPLPPPRNLAAGEAARGCSPPPRSSGPVTAAGGGEAGSRLGRGPGGFCPRAA